MWSSISTCAGVARFECGHGGSGLGLRAVHGLLARGKRLPPATVGSPDSATGALVALIGPAADAGLLECIDDAVFAGRAEVVDGAGKRGRGHNSRPNGSTERIGDDLHIHPVPVVARVEGPVGGDGRSAAGSRREGRTPFAMRLGRPRRGWGRGRPAGRQPRGCSGRRYSSRSGNLPRAEAYVAPFPQMRQGQEGLTASREPAPTAADPAAVFTPARSKEKQGPAGHVQPARVDKHTKPLVGRGDLGREPTYQGLHPSVTPTCQPTRQVGKGSLLQATRRTSNSPLHSGHTGTRSSTGCSRISPQARLPADKSRSHGLRACRESTCCFA